MLTKQNPGPTRVGCTREFQGLALHELKHFWRAGEAFTGRRKVLATAVRKIKKNCQTKDNDEKKRGKKKCHRDQKQPPPPPPE